jgi:mono/diheme cytochrome c family protein
MRTGIVALAFVVMAASAPGNQKAGAPSPTPTAPPVEAIQGAVGPDLGEASLGEVVYTRYCAACHGRSLKGDGPVASGLIKRPTDLTRLSAKNGGAFPFDKVAAAIDGRHTTRVHGTPDMPVWGEVFALTAGADAPNAEAAVKRLTHYVWANQAKPQERPAGK